MIAIPSKKLWQSNMDGWCPACIRDWWIMMTSGKRQRGTNGKGRRNSSGKQINNGTFSACCCTCIHCTEGTSTQYVDVLISSNVLCPGFWSGVNVTGGNLNGLYRLPAVVSSEACEYRYAEDPGTSVTATFGGQPMGLSINAFRATNTKWEVLVYLFPRGSGEVITAQLFIGLSSGSITDCSVPFSVANTIPVCTTPALGGLETDVAHDGTASCTPV